MARSASLGYYNVNSVILKIFLFQTSLQGSQHEEESFEVGLAQVSTNAKVPGSTGGKTRQPRMDF